MFMNDISLSTYDFNLELKHTLLQKKRFYKKNCLTVFAHHKNHNRSSPPNSNTVNSKFHLIQSLVQISVHMPIFSMLNWTIKFNMVNSKFHAIQTFQHKLNSK